MTKLVDLFLPYSSYVEIPPGDKQQARILRDTYNQLLDAKFHVYECIEERLKRNESIHDLLILKAVLTTELYELDNQVHRILFVPFKPIKKKK